MMKIKVELLPGLRPIRKETKFEMTLKERATVKDLLLEIGFGMEELQYLRVWVGKEMASLSTVLDDSDEVLVAVPIGGG